MGGVSNKVFETLFSVKFYILAASTALLVLGYIDQGTWMTMMLTTAGFRTANELATIFKTAPVKAGQSSAQIAIGRKR